MRARTFMMVQYFKRDYYHWQNKDYSDKEIIKNADKFNGKSYAKGKYKDLHWIYEHYYWPMIHHYQHPFNDYDFVFSGKSKDEATKIQFHVIFRFLYFYFRDSLHNKRYSKNHAKITTPIVASIMHDKDKKLGLDSNKHEIKVTIPPHLHYVFKFKKQFTPSQLSKWCGIDPQYFETGRGGRYALENTMAYLVHAKQPEKHLYDFRDVWSNKPTFNYQEYYIRHKKQWTNYRAKRIGRSHGQSIDWLAQQVQHGNLTKEDILRNRRYRYVYADHMKKINDAVEFHAEVTGELTLMALRRQKFSLSVFYIWGQPGSGKSYLALNLANDLAKKYNWRIYQGASTNSLDDYSGEQIVLLDDVRSQTMGASDWLKLLDPINISPNSARFHNKEVSARVIIMTNPEPPAKFFGYMKNVHGNEPLSQFIRRLTQIAHVICTSSSDHEVLLSNVKKLNKTYQVPIGVKSDMSGDNTQTITRGTRYVSDPNQNDEQVLTDDKEPESEALKAMLKVVKKKNNPLVKHPAKDKDMISLEDYLRDDNTTPFGSDTDDKNVPNPFKD